MSQWITYLAASRCLLSRKLPLAVEHTHSWLGPLIKLLVSVAKSEANYATVLSLASALIR